MKTRVWLGLVVIAWASAGSALGAGWSDGFESGDFSAWDGTWHPGTPPSVVTSLPGLTPRTGQFMARLALDPYDASGSGFEKNVNLTAEGAYVSCYLGLSTDGADYPASSIALHVQSSNAYMQIENDK